MTKSTAVFLTAFCGAILLPTVAVAICGMAAQVVLVVVRLAGKLAAKRLLAGSPRAVSPVFSVSLHSIFLSSFDFLVSRAAEYRRIKPV